MNPQSQLVNRARQAMPGGVNSPVRAFQAVGANPLFAAHGNGAVLTTTDGQELIDYCMSFGPLILGHAHPDIVQAITEAAKRGTSYAMTTEAEIEMAECIRSAIPTMERIRLVNSGTEACMTAIRLARGATGRNKIIKFTGCYHGHADCLLVKAGSGVAGIADASSDGVPKVCANQTLLARYNHPEDLEQLLATHGSEVAAILVEPVAANMGLVKPRDGFLSFLREQSSRHGALLIFDAVICGFRFCFGEYQNICGVTPDLTCLGKIIGGGLPVGAVGGRADIMEHLAPLGGVYQAGTLSGNPISVAAGLATLKRLRDDNPYPALESKTRTLTDGISHCAQSAGVPLQVPQQGSLFSVFFSDQPVRNFEDVTQTRSNLFHTLFHELLKRGIYLPPSPFEVSFLSTAHTDAQIQQTLNAWDEALQVVAKMNNG